jgi:hypothetical protein
VKLEEIINIIRTAVPDAEINVHRMPPIIVAFGGGANSTAMLVEMHRRGILPDLIMFADTGGERPETYDAVSMVDLWCRQHFGIGVEVVRKTYQGQPETLEDNCLRMNMLPSIAYGFKSCSLKHKVDPQDKFTNNWEPAVTHWETGGKCEKWIGYDAGEERRAKIRDDAKYTYRYPLIEWGIYREDCIRICNDAGLPAVKSSCFFCPSMKKREIVELAAKHPRLAARAVAMEQQAKLTSVVGLGRSFAWGDFLRNEAAQGKLFDDAGTPETPCGCYDGGVDLQENEINEAESISKGNAMWLKQNTAQIDEREQDEECHP